MPGPFENLRVIEFGRFIAAPYCGQLLADGGADVIKVEPLDGDETRRNGYIFPGEGRQFLNKNRGKRSLAVDLGDQEVAAAVRELVRKADVVVANFRPGQAKRHGLDYESLSATNPRLIYAENTAYGRDGPPLDPGRDLVRHLRLPSLARPERIDSRLLHPRLPTVVRRAMNPEIAASLANANSLGMSEQRYTPAKDHVIVGHGGTVSFSGLTTREVCPTTTHPPSWRRGTVYTT